MRRWRAMGEWAVQLADAQGRRRGMDIREHKTDVAPLIDGAHLAGEPQDTATTTTATRKPYIDQPQSQVRRQLKRHSYYVLYHDKDDPMAELSRLARSWRSSARAVRTRGSSYGRRYMASAQPSTRPQAAQGQADHPRVHRLEGEIMGQAEGIIDEGHGDEPLAIRYGRHHDRGASVHEGDRWQDPQTGV